MLLIDAHPPNRVLASKGQYTIDLAVFAPLMEAVGTGALHCPNLRCEANPAGVREGDNLATHEPSPPDHQRDEWPGDGE